MAVLDGGVRVTEPDARRRTGAFSLVELVDSTPDLFQVGDDDVTDITIDDPTSIRPGDLAWVLERFEGTTARHSWTWPDHVLREEERQLPGGCTGGILLIDGVRWVYPVGGSSSTVPWVPLDTDEEIATVEFDRTWSSYSDVENESRTAGTSVWELGVIYGITISRTDLDEIGRRINVRGVPGRLPAIANWLADLKRDVNLDTVMFALEQLHGTPEWTRLPEPAMASTFDSNGSDTCECSIALDVAEHEIEILEELLRSAGFDWQVDAIRDPKSAAADERRKRLAEADW